MEKKYVQVIARHLTDGAVRPLKIEYEERWHEVDRVLDARMAASLKAGGQGIRYTCRIAGKEIYLFCDDGKWFLE